MAKYFSVCIAYYVSIYTNIQQYTEPAQRWQLEGNPWKEVINIIYQVCIRFIDLTWIIISYYNWLWWCLALLSCDDISWCLLLWQRHGWVILLGSSSPSFALRGHLHHNHHNNIATWKGVHPGTSTFTTLRQEKTKCNPEGTRGLLWGEKTAPSPI